jgi:hypothetical protein
MTAANYNEHINLDLEHKKIKEQRHGVHHNEITPG